MKYFFFRKPSNKISPDKFKFFNPPNLVKAIGIGPRERKKAQYEMLNKRLLKT